MSAKRRIFVSAAACCLFAATTLAQGTGDGGQQPAPPENVPPAGEPRAQEQLPEAPPEQTLKSPPPLEKKDGAQPAQPAKPQPLPNTLPPAQKIEPKVPNT
jgi:hypothetical protein